MATVQRTENYQSLTAQTPNKVTSVTSTSAVVLSANGNRLECWVQNISASGNIWISLGSAATANSGLLLGPGQTWSATTFTGAVWAVSDGTVLAGAIEV